MKEKWTGCNNKGGICTPDLFSFSLIHQLCPINCWPCHCIFNFNYCNFFTDQKVLFGLFQNLFGQFIHVFTSCLLFVKHIKYIYFKFYITNSSIWRCSRPYSVVLFSKYIELQYIFLLMNCVLFLMWLLHYWVFLWQILEHLFVV